MGLMKAKNEQMPALDSTPTPEDLPMLLRGLHSTDAELRRMSARDLMQFPESVHALAAQLEVEQDVVVSEAIVNTLAQIGNAAAVEVLIPFLRSENVFIRNETIEVLKGLPAVVAPAMEELLSDEDADVRIFAVNVLESLRHPKVVSWLIHVIDQDAHVNVCATALDLLAEVGDESCLSALTRVKARFLNEPYLQFVAQMAEGRILEGKGIPS